MALSSSVSGVGITDEKLTCLTTTSKHSLKGDGEWQIADHAHVFSQISHFGTFNPWDFGQAGEKIAPPPPAPFPCVHQIYAPVTLKIYWHKNPLIEEHLFCRF